MTSIEEFLSPGSSHSSSNSSLRNSAPPSIANLSTAVARVHRSGLTAQEKDFALIELLSNQGLALLINHIPDGEDVTTLVRQFIESEIEKRHEARYTSILENLESTAKYLRACTKMIRIGSGMPSSRGKNGSMSEIFDANGEGFENLLDSLHLKDPEEDEDEEEGEEAGEVRIQARTASKGRHRIGIIGR